MNLTDDTFYIYAAHYYDNPQCSSMEEFEEDLKLIQYIKRLFNRFENTGQLKERLILNHIIVIQNCFGPATAHMLFMKLDGQHHLLKPFLEKISLMPEFVIYNDKKIHKDEINSCPFVADILRKST